VIDSSSLYRNGRDCENGIPGAAYYCTATASAALVNIRESWIAGNEVRNSNTRTWLRNSGDPNRFFSVDGAAKYSDLPGGGNGLVAFLLASWRTGTPSMHNTVEGKPVRRLLREPVRRYRILRHSGHRV
jgi:hypothetical protein